MKKIIMYGVFIFATGAWGMEEGDKANPIIDIGDTITQGNMYYAQAKFDLAEECYMKAAEAGYVKGMFNLGTACAKQGKLDEAELWYKKAAEAGHVGAMFNLGLTGWRQGKLDVAEQWYKKAAEAGYLTAMNCLGVVYKKQGRLDLAQQWYKKAAKAGHVKAMFNLGLAGLREGKDFVAKYYLQQAADAGDMDAELLLAQLEEIGLSEHHLREAKKLECEHHERRLSYLDGRLRGFARMREALVEKDTAVGSGKEE